MGEGWLDSYFCGAKKGNSVMRSAVVGDYLVQCYSLLPQSIMGLSSCDKTSNLRGKYLFENSSNMCFEIKIKLLTFPADREYTPNMRMWISRNKNKQTADKHEKGENTK